MKRKTIKNKKKSAGFDLMPVILFLVITALALTIYVGYRAAMSERKLFSVSLLALFAGLLFESFRITDNWKHVIYKFIGAYFFSLLCFLPGKNEKIYDFENHIAFWPYGFIFFFALITVISNKEKVTAKLTEGITLLQSISIIYWIIDYGFINVDNWFAILLLIIVLAFSVFSIVQAITYFKLSRTVRLTLSVWSTFIMLAFAIDNIYRVYQNEDIEATTYISEQLYIGLQFFFLGVSVIYITQNYFLLAGFLPSKNSSYKNDLRETKKDHVERYSETQVPVRDSLICILYTVTIYVLNYKYQVLPRHTMIWLVFLTFPLILKFRELIIGKNTFN